MLRSRLFPLESGYLTAFPADVFRQKEGDGKPRSSWNHLLHLVAPSKKKIPLISHDFPLPLTKVLNRFPSLRIRQSGNWAVQEHMSFDFEWLLLYLVTEEGTNSFSTWMVTSYSVIFLELFKGKMGAQFTGKHGSSNYTSYLRETACTKWEPQATSLNPLPLMGKSSRKALQEPWMQQLHGWLVTVDLGKNLQGVEPCDLWDNQGGSGSVRHRGPLLPHCHHSSITFTWSCGTPCLLLWGTPCSDTCWVHVGGAHGGAAHTTQFTAMSLFSTGEHLERFPSSHPTQGILFGLQGNFAACSQGICFQMETQWSPNL